MRIFTIILSIICIVLTFNLTQASTYFHDDFENGDLSNWTIGGRQLGTHTADVVPSDRGGLCGHLYQNGAFTEITLSRDFPFQSNDTFYFDLKVDVGTTTPPASNYYGISGVGFKFLDLNDTELGAVWYLAATTDYPVNYWVNDSTNVNLISENVWHSFELGTTDILSQIIINQSEIDKVRMMFETYSSTWPYPIVSAELWVDNVSDYAVPLPSALLLFSSGLIGAVGLRRWIC